jgi:hypothetical protein
MRSVRIRSDGIRAAHRSGMSQTLQTLSLDQLSSITGGQAEGGEEGPPRRTWGQVAREYAGACVSGAGQSFIYGGRPRNWRQGVTQAAIGCATGVGMRAIEDVSGAISGNGNQGY